MIAHKKQHPGISAQIQPPPPREKKMYILFVSERYQQKMVKCNIFAQKKLNENE